MAAEVGEAGYGLIGYGITMYQVSMIQPQELNSELTALSPSAPTRAALCSPAAH